MKDIKNEIWKDVIGYEGKYQVSNFGRVKSVAKSVSCHSVFTRHQKEVILKPSKKRNGYLAVSLSFETKRLHISVHRLVALNFINNTENKEVVNHIDGDKHNNCVSNLEWNTQSQNVKHGFDVLGRTKPKGMKDVKGIDNPLSIKINQSDMNGNLIKVWDCMQDAGRSGFGVGNIYSCCRGKRKHHKGYKWSYTEVLEAV